MDLDEFNEFFKNYAPLTICFILALIMVTIGDRARASLIVITGIVLQLVWSFRRYRRH